MLGVRLDCKAEETQRGSGLMPGWVSGTEGRVRRPLEPEQMTKDDVIMATDGLKRKRFWNTLNLRCWSSIQEGTSD